MKCVNCPETMCKYRGRVELDCVYEEREKLFAEEPHKNAVDWSTFRREVAKDILCAMVSGGYEKGREASQAHLALDYADELIKQLKEK